MVSVFASILNVKGSNVTSDVCGVNILLFNFFK
jgi:hypothetical protein